MSFTTPLQQSCNQRQSILGIYYVHGHVTLIIKAYFKQMSQHFAQDDALEKMLSYLFEQ